MAGSLFEIFKRDAESDDEPLAKEEIFIKGQRFIVLVRTIINHSPSPGDVYAELELIKPRGYISYAADEIFKQRAIQKTGIAWIDKSSHPQPVYHYKLRPDREINQADVERKTQEKSRCCKRTFEYVSQGPGRLPKRFCRKCGQEAL
jgi:hypothetical protein